MNKSTCIYCAAPATRWCDLVLGFDSAGGPLATLKTEIYRCDAPLCAEHAVFKGNIFFDGSKKVQGMETVDHCQGHAPGEGGLLPISAGEAAQLRYRHRFAAVLVEIGDDEKPTQPPAAAPAPAAMPRAHMGDCCYRTVMWCQEPKFWEFLNQRYAAIGCAVTSEKEAGEVVRHVCGVASRKELDTENEANKAWHRLIREPYRVYLAGTQ